MLPYVRASLILLGLIAPAVCPGTSDWSKVRTGITAATAAEALGRPLIRTYGRGIEVWIYDGCGEIMFAGGPALGWSLPVPNPESAARPVEQDVLLRPVIRLPALRGLTPQRSPPFLSS